MNNGLGFVALVFFAATLVMAVGAIVYGISSLCELHSSRKYMKKQDRLWMHECKGLAFRWAKIAAMFAAAAIVMTIIGKVCLL